jgi:hypothetical protein
MADPSKWDWADTLSGMLLGVVSGILSLFGWFSTKVGTVHDRIDAVHDRINIVTQAASDQAASIKVLEAHHGAKLQRLDRIEGNLTAINEKQDRQMEILMDLRGRGH